jgi:formylglycine-generating enzyme required for sulfatase activity
MLASVAHGDDLSLPNWIDAAADEFERQLRLAGHPRIEDFVASAPQSARDELLRELLLLEIEYRSKCGGAVDIEEYHRRFPNARSLIGGALETIRHVPASGSDTVAETTGRSNCKQVGRFALAEVLGRGTCGVVYRATDTALCRDVAIKIPHSLLAADGGEVERFLREARNAAQLKHPGIVRVLEVGVLEGIPFIVSEYIAGPSLAELPPAGKAVEFRTIAEFAAEIAEALEAAHSCGVVHRDLKPSNLLLERRERAAPRDASATLADYRPRIADFGLARRMDSVSHPTAEGDILGTPAYMSPEQARGNAYAADARSDVFSLGVMFYELLCGKRPFSGGTPELLHQMANRPMPDARRANPRVPAGLAVICQRCVQLDPHRRYQSAGEIAADLRRWLAGLPIMAKRVGAWERLSLWMLRHKRAVSAAAAAVLGLLILAAAVAVRSIQLASAEHAATAEAVEGVKTAPADLLAGVIRRLDGRPHVDAELERALAVKDLPANQRVRLLLANLPYDHTVVSELAQLLSTLAPREYVVVSDGLAPYQRTACRLVSQQLMDNQFRSPQEWLKATSFVARYSPADAKDLVSSQEFIARLVGVANEEPEAWARIVKPFAQNLVVRLRARFQGDTSDAERLTACELLVELEADDLPELMFLLKDADGPQLPVIITAIKRHATAALPMLRQQWKAGYDVATHKSMSELSARAVANFALAMVSLGDQQAVSPTVKTSPDPRCREYFVHRVAVAGVRPQILVDRLTSEGAGDIQYALLIALGEYPVQALDAGSVSRMDNWLRKTYSTSPDSGVHCAAGWLLSRWGRGEWVRAADFELAREGSRSDRNWFVNSLGITMVVIRGPTTFTMGASPTEDSPHAFENRHEHRIPRSFAISVTEVTCDQFARYVPGFLPNRTASPLGDCPVAGVSWRAALGFCLWLTRREGLTAVEAEAVASTADAGFQIRFDRFGYRLPTAGEWECACRAGTTTSRSCGEAATPYLADYAWWSDREQRSAQVGSKAPNLWGLFDCYGNADEWVATRFTPGPQSEEEPSSILLPADSFLFQRGGGYDRREAMFRSSWATPMQASVNERAVPGVEVAASRTDGFRIACTVK